MRKSSFAIALALLAAAAQAQIPEAVTEQPAGTEVFYSRSGCSVQLKNGNQISWGQESDVAIEAVKTDNGDIYFKNYLGHLFNPERPVWLKGHQEGSTLTIQLPQIAYIQYNNDGTELQGVLYAMINTLSDKVVPEVAPTERQTVTFEVLPDGTLLQQGEDIMGLSMAQGEPQFQGYGEFQTTMSPLTRPMAQAPAGIEWSEWSLTHGDGGHRLKVAFDGNGNIYFKGIYPGCPDGIAVASVTNDEVLLESEQLMGIAPYARRFCNLYGATPDATWSQDWLYNTYSFFMQPNVTLHYDADAQAITGAQAQALAVSPNVPATGELLVGYHDFKIFRQDGYGQPNRPCNPVIHKFEAFKPSDWPTLGMGGLAFETPYLDRDGGLLNPDQLYYSIYIDDEDGKLWCDPLDYPTIAAIAPEGTDEIPAKFDDAFDFNLNISPIFHQMFLRVYGMERIGVQQVYKAGGESHVSDIVWMDTATNEISTQNVSDPLGLSETTAKQGQAQWYDITGRSVAVPGHGLYIKVQNGKAIKVKL